ncbi:hypothetical protein HDU87_001928 [Geranomyces variabilis]|uniref:Uncharacterized protein n=1 Tax=Geranomyces variabilis TaxID=109894 RepID=A0AAD5TLR5_9FUNG|nr:hypothetical protein HDU87_001928 [Geranomyces variabilis]
MGSSRLVEPGDLVTAIEFKILVNFVYLPMSSKQLKLSAAKVTEARAVARAMQVPALDRAILDMLAQDPAIATWKNVESLLAKATKQPRWEAYNLRPALVAQARRTLDPKKYDLPSLLDEKHYKNLPHDPWNDPFFALLSDKLQCKLLLARSQNVLLQAQNTDKHMSKPFRLGHPCDLGPANGYPYGRGSDIYTITAYAPDALTTSDIAATVVKTFPAK